MAVVNLNIRDEVLDKVMYILKSFPKKDVQIISKKLIEEIDPTKLSKDNFDYMSPKELSKIDMLIEEAKNSDFKNMQSFDELKNT